MNNQELSSKILKFITKYAKKVPTGDSYTSPDAYSLLTFAQCLVMDDFDLKNIKFPDSSFFQGGYYEEGEKEHEEIMDLIYNLMNPKCPYCNEKIHISYNFCIHCGKQI